MQIVIVNLYKMSVGIYQDTAENWFYLILKAQVFGGSRYIVFIQTGMLYCLRKNGPIKIHEFFFKILYMIF